jgi:MYXO-CTERM domain-containing protein
VTRPLVALYSLSFAAGLLGCTEPRVAETLEQEERAIVNGTLSDPSDNAVLYVRGGGSGCTGTLIAPDVVLTALHCLSNFDSTTSFVCQSDGTLAPGSSNGMLGPTVDPAVVAVGFGVQVGSERIHGKEIFSTNSPEVCRDDVAVVVLERAPDIGNVPLVSLRFDRPTERGEVTRAVGYGDTMGTNTENGRQERRGIPILGVGAPNSASMGDRGVAPRTLSTGMGPCKGDSGGPLFSEDTGAQVGIYSLLVSSTCIGDDVRNVYTNVAPFESLIRKALASAGREPLVEPPLPTGGDAGATGQAGETGTAGASGETGEGGAPSGSGGTGGGSGARGGAGGSGAVGGTSDGTGGDAAAGAVPAAAGTGAESVGSGSRRDGGCACRAAGTSQQTPWSWAGLSLAALTFVRRRRAR